MIVQYFLILLFLPLLITTAGQFDLAEYRRVSYDATIGENFLWFAPDLDLREVTTDNIDVFEKKIIDNIPDESLPNYVFITSKGGQKFACSLPEVEELKFQKPRAPRSSKNPKVYGETLAASFYVEKCIKLRERTNWWSYTLCRGRTVEQTHGEQGEEGFVKNILGIYDGSLAMPPFQESTEDRLLYLEESYTSGTFCEINREPRRTTVRYECDSQLSTNEAYISSLVEVVPCQYLMIVKVGSLCHYPEFLPVTLANTKNIACQPYLTRKDVRELLQRQLEEKTKKDDLKRKMTVTKLEFNRAIERYNAMSKSQRNLHLPDVSKKINAEIVYRAAHYNLLVASLEIEGETVTKKKQDYMWKVFSTADIGDYMFYADYDSIEDENRAHLWYYFNDPTWPRNQFPKDILITGIQNSYIEEVQKNLKGKYVFDDNGGFVEGLTHFLKTGKIDLEYNLIIPAMEIYDEILVNKMMLHLQRYYWLGNIFIVFNDERAYMEEESTEAVDEIMDSMRKPSSEKYPWPMANLAKKAIPTLVEEVFEDLHELSENGPKSELFDSELLVYKRLYKNLKIDRYPEDQEVERDEHVYKFNVTALRDHRTKYDMYMLYLRLLAPAYKLLSIRWFQQQNSKYFHTSPPSKEHLKPSDSDDYKFHYNLARDMSRFANVLVYSTMITIKDFEKWRDGKKADPISVKGIQKHVFKMLENDSERAIKIAFHVLNEDTGSHMVSEARLRIWERKHEAYKTSFWTKDYKLRKQAQSMQGLMKDFLSMKDDSDAFVSLGGKSESKKQKTADSKLLEKLSKINSIDDIDFEALKERLVSSDDDFFDWEDVQEVLDLLDKAGLSKKAQVQIKMFDADGNEIKSEELDSITKSFLDDGESINRFKESEKAYLKKLLKKFEEKEEEEKDGENTG